MRNRINLIQLAASLFFAFAASASGAIVVETQRAQSPARAPAVVTENETSLDNIFSQSVFGTTPIDIRFVSTQTIIDPSLSSIDNTTNLDDLFNSGNASSPAVNMYFVDSILWCGGPPDPGFTIAGCADEPGHNLVVESDTAAGSNGGLLLAHELGHNLGLMHVGTSSSNDNLMNPVLGGSSALSTTQVNTILSSGLVQTDTSNARFIAVNTVLVAVPEPSAMAFSLLVFAFGAAAMTGRAAWARLTSRWLTTS